MGRLILDRRWRIRRRKRVSRFIAYHQYEQQRLRWCRHSVSRAYIQDASGEDQKQCLPSAQLGAFGFLSSDEVYRYGTVNAGLKDMTFALQWVQSYIGLFGGNASAVTISGESAGGGACMLQSMAFGGDLGTSLFRQVWLLHASINDEDPYKWLSLTTTQVIASSPYLPQQWNYGDFVPSQSYYAFAQAVGCFNGMPQSNITTTSIFKCLTTKDTLTLQNASAVISGSGRFGTWGFLPVTDGTYIQQLPSQQLLKKQVNGINALVGVKSYSSINKGRRWLMV